MSRLMNVLVAATLLCATHVLAVCDDPSPAFPPSASKVLAKDKGFWTDLENIVDNVLAGNRYNTSSFSIEVTTSERTLWSQYHTASVLNESIGVREVDGNSRFRIASVSKSFTVLALLHQVDAGKLRLDDSIKEYIEEFNGPHAGTLPWKDITLRSLASQLSGIPRELSLSEVGLQDPTKYGLPMKSRPKDLPKCDTYTPGFPTNIKPCTRRDLMDRLASTPPVLAPNQKSTYSNVAFELLGLVLEDVTGRSYDKLIHQTILEPIGMTNTSTTTPNHTVMAIPALDNWWSNDLGVQLPTGGIYSSSSDLSRYLRYILTHYNALAGINWFGGVSWSGSESSFYGMPWEIFRTSKILSPISRPTTFITKGGSLPGYYSHIIMLPDYGLGVTILVAGEQALLAKLREEVTVPLVRAVDTAIAKDIDKRYSGIYVPQNTTLNTTLTLHVSPQTGLTLTTFISNSTDVLTTIFHDLLQDPNRSSLPRSAWRAQLVPTLLYKNQSTLNGETWRVVPVRNRGTGASNANTEDGEVNELDDNDDDTIQQELIKHVKLEEEGRARCQIEICGKLFKNVGFWRKHVGVRHRAWFERLREQFGAKPQFITSSTTEDESNGIWTNDCLTDVDNVMYMGTPVNEVVFYFDDNDRVKKIELSAFGVTLVPKREELEDLGEFGSEVELEEEEMDFSEFGAEVELDGEEKGQGQGQGQQQVVLN